MFIKKKYLNYILWLGLQIVVYHGNGQTSNSFLRERISLDTGWKFMRYQGIADSLIYDIRPEITDRSDAVVADTKPTESIRLGESETVLKKWILPTANPFINDPKDRHLRPVGNPGKHFPFVQTDFDDNSWETVQLPHDWAIMGPFYKEENAIVGGGMGRLPVHGVAWYRRKVEFPKADSKKTIYLDIDGAMSYSMVWINGILVGGWPYGYNSYRLDLTPFIKFGETNQLAIRIDNPTNSSRWYPGAGLYRMVWLSKLDRIHVGHWGSFIYSKRVTELQADMEMELTVQNKGFQNKQVIISTEIFELDDQLKQKGKAVVSTGSNSKKIEPGNAVKITQSFIIKNPRLWGPFPDQIPHLYKAVTSILIGSAVVDKYETIFGVRTISFHSQKGLQVNGKPFRLQGVNQHHDLGALGAAFNYSAAKRQLEILKEMGCNAIRMAHNPPAPELLELTDRMGFMVIDEIFDSWERKKTPHDFHLIFPDWMEPDARSFVRRDRNHPSVIAWSFGNEVGEQYTDQAGAELAKKLNRIIKEEDPTRPTTASMNFAKPFMPFPHNMDLIGLNYQGEGIRDAPAYAHLQGIKTSPLYPAFRETFPDKLIFSSETASTLSSRGAYFFPVTPENSAPVSEGIGGNRNTQEVSAYELYTAAFGASPDKVFASQDKHLFVAGEFVWTGWDYLGEPTPYYSARSSYSGIIDLAGFKKDRFYLYQSRWRSDSPMVHLLPHWNWPDRLGLVTPVHVFTSGDEAELFLNGKSLGRKKKQPFEYRLRWDSVLYEPGKLHVVAYKMGKYWAAKTVVTTGAANKIELEADQLELPNHKDSLCFITIKLVDAAGNVVPNANILMELIVEGGGELVATDNGNPADLVPFCSSKRNAYNGYLLAIVKPKKAGKDKIIVMVKGENLLPGEIEIKLK